MQVDMLFVWKSLPARLIDYFTMALHTCDTLRWYQRPLYARIEQRESTQNGETVAVKCPIHKSLRWMLCWSLGGPFFQTTQSNPVLFKLLLDSWKVVRCSKQLKWTRDALRNICSFPIKKRWWVARVFIFNMVCVSLPDVALNLKPVSSITHCTCSKAISSQVKLDCSIIQSTQRNQNKTRYVLPAIMGPSPNSRGSCIPRLPEKYLPPLGAVDCSSVGNKATWVITSNHGLDLEVIFTTFAHHVITLKDKRIEQLNITIHHKQEGAVWCHTTNGCTAEIPATC